MAGGNVIFPIRDTIPSTRRPYAMWAIIIINLAVFLWEQSLGPTRYVMAMQTYGAVPEGIFSLNRLYTLLTYMFLHGGWWHLIVNMWVFYIFGDNIESLTGPARFILFYLFCGIAAMLVQVLMDPESMMPVVGASGAVAGIMGAYFLRYPRARVVTLIIFIFVEIPAFIFLALWVLIQFLSGMRARPGLDDVAWWAHVGGFAAGLLFLRFFELKKPVRKYHGAPPSGFSPSPLLPPSKRRDERP